MTSISVDLAGEDFSFMARQMGRWVEEILRPNYQRYRPGRTWSPSINLYEDAAQYCLVVDLAGVERESINLQIEKGKIVHLSGERPSPRLPTDAEAASGSARRMHVMEIDHGPFLRRLELPERVDADRVEASLRSGFLWVRLPKRSAARASGR